MYKIDIKEALYPIGIVSVVYKKLSKTSVFIDRKWPILNLIFKLCFTTEYSNLMVSYEKYLL